MIGLEPIDVGEGLVSRASSDGLDARSARVEELLAAARRGDAGARWGAMHACRDYLRLVARRTRLPRGNPGPSPSDFVQNALIEGWRGFSRFRGQSPGQLRGWLRVILLRSLLRAARRPVEGRLDACQPGGEPVAEVTPASAVAVRNDWNRTLDSALRRLPTHYRTVIHLRLWDDLSFPQIGARLGLSEDSARKLFTRAVLRLRETLGKDHGLG